MKVTEALPGCKTGKSQTHAVGDDCPPRVGGTYGENLGTSNVRGSISCAFKLISPEDLYLLPENFVHRRFPSKQLEKSSRVFYRNFQLQPLRQRSLHIRLNMRRRNGHRRERTE